MFPACMPHYFMFVLRTMFITTTMVICLTPLISFIIRHGKQTPRIPIDFHVILDFQSVVLLKLRFPHSRNETIYYAQ